MLSDQAIQEIEANTNEGETVQFGNAYTAFQVYFGGKEWERPWRVYLLGQHVQAFSSLTNAVKAYPSSITGTDYFWKIGQRVINKPLGL